MANNYETTLGREFANSFQDSNIKELLFSTEGLFLAGIFVVIALGSLLRGGSRGAKATKGKLATGRFGGYKELARAKRVALDQIQARQKQPVATWIGEPTSNPFERAPIYLVAGSYYEVS